MLTLPVKILITEQVSSIELCAWLGGLPEYKTSSASFMTIEDVGKFLESMTRSLFLILDYNMEQADLLPNSPGQPEGERRLPSHN